MTAADSAGDPPSRRENTDRSLQLPARARPRAARRRFATTTRGRFEGPAAQNFLRQLRALDFGNSIVLFGSSLLTALLRIGLGLFSAVYFSSAIISDSRLYGTIGVVFTLLTWFIAIGAVIVLGAVGGATWDQRKSRSGRTKTGSSDPGNDGPRPSEPATPDTRH